MQIKAEVDEVDELKQYQPMYKFDLSEKGKVIELKVCQECFENLGQRFISEDNTNYRGGNINGMRTGLDLSQVNFQDDPIKKNLQNDKDGNGRTRFVHFSKGRLV